MFTCTAQEPAQKKAGVSEGTSGAAGLGPAPAQGPSADFAEFSRIWGGLAFWILTEAVNGRRGFPRGSRILKEILVRHQCPENVKLGVMNFNGIFEHAFPGISTFILFISHLGLWLEVSHCL